MTTREQADQRIKAVDAAFDKAEGAWTSTGISLGSLFGVSPQEQVLGAIRSMRRLGRDPWAARAQRLTDIDQDGWNAWVRDGNDLLKNLAGTAQDAQVSSLDAVVAATVVATAADTAKAAASVVKWTAITTPLVVVGAGLVLWKTGLWRKLVTGGA